MNEHRISEQAQTKVEASQKFPISLNGMVLFNAFANSAASGTDNAGEYGLLSGPNRSGATMRQTLLGFDFQGPALPGNGRVNASLNDGFLGRLCDSRFQLVATSAGLIFPSTGKIAALQWGKINP